MPESWTEASIADVTTSFVSIDPTKTPDQPFRYVDIGSIDNATQSISDPKSFLGRDAPSRARRVIHAGDSLFSTVRTYLKNIALVPDELDGELTSTGIAVLRPNGAVDARYLFRWTCSDQFVEPLSGAQDGTMYPAVSDRDVSAASIPLPPLPEQRRIVAKIDSLTGKSKRAREQLDHIPRLVEKYKQAVLAAAFRGDLTRQWRAERKISDHWNQVTLDELIDEGPTNGWSPKSGPDATRALTLKLTATTSGIMRLDDNAVKRIYDTPRHTSNYWLKPGDLLVQRANCLEYVGSSAIYDGPVETFIYPDLMMRLRIYDPDRRQYVWRFLNSQKAREYFRAQATGTAGNMPKISGGTLRALNVPIPNLDVEYAEVVRCIETAFTWIDRLASDATSARKLIDRLDQAVLAKAFRGELVPQDPADEPASALLDRIKATRADAVPRSRRRAFAG